MKSLQLDPKKNPIMNIIIWTNRNELVDIKASVTLSNSAHSTYDDTSDFLGDDSFFFFFSADSLHGAWLWW